MVVLNQNVILSPELKDTSPYKLAKYKRKIFKLIFVTNYTIFFQEIWIQNDILCRIGQTSILCLNRKFYVPSQCVESICQKYVRE